MRIPTLPSENSKPSEELGVWASRKRILFTILVVAVVFVAIWSQEEKTVVAEMEVGHIGTRVYEIKADVLLEMNEKLKKAKEEMIEEFRTDYGEFTDVVFNDAFVSDLFMLKDGSKEKLKRRMLIRLLESGMYGKSDFIWVTAGHSAAAGHGNLFNQSYSRSLELAAENVFKSVGINFQAKNYAMGSYSSGPELALCIEALFGPHIDILSWDFGMTDGNKYFLYKFWINRAIVHPTKPILWNFDRQRHRFYDYYPGIGGFTFKGFDPQTFPDSQTHPNPASLPPAVAYFRCKNEAENQPPCNDHKFATYGCKKQPKYQVKWHPGWKAHLVTGNIFAYYLVMMLEEVLNDLLNEVVNKAADEDSQSEGKVTKDYLEALRKQDQQDLSDFLKSDLPKDWPTETDVSKLYRSKVYCTSAILPNEARYHGLVTETTSGEPVWGGMHVNFDLGVPHKPVPEALPDRDDIEPILTYDETFRQPCSEVLEIDYKDYFMVRQKDGWMTRTYPNAAELEEFGKGNNTREGMIVLCSRVCLWYKCEKEYVPLKQLPTNLTVEVDGHQVHQSKELNQLCEVISGDIGQGNENGQYTIKFRVNRPDGQLFLSSVIVL